MRTVFISYSSKDRGFAERLAADLRASGTGVWFDQWEIRVGDSITQKINDGIHDNDYLAVVLSPDSVASPWVKKELNAAMMKELNRRSVFVLPIFYRDCEIPALIADKHYADFRKSYEAGLSEILRVLAPGEVRPPPVPPRRQVNWKRVGTIAGVIAVLIALGAWLVPNAVGRLFQTPTATPTGSPTHTPVISSTLETYTIRLTPIFNQPPKAVISGPTSGSVGERLSFSGADSTDPDGRILSYAWDFGDGTTGSGVNVTHSYEAAGTYKVTLTVTDNGGATDISAMAIAAIMIPHHKDMIHVPAGEFTMGSDEGDKDELPQHRVYLDAFDIDKTEVTNAQYRECVKKGHCSEPHNTVRYNDPTTYAEDPVVYVDWNQANAYCEWMGKQLPTEAEWERAARGTDGRVYPWGNEWDENKLNSYEARLDDTTSVGSYPAGASPRGALDMAGNVWEWCSSLYQNYPYDPDDGREDLEAEGPRVLRSGSWANNQQYARCATRNRETPSIGRPNVGFRCATDSQ